MLLLWDVVIRVCLECVCIYRGILIGGDVCKYVCDFVLTMWFFLDLSEVLSLRACVRSLTDIGLCASFSNPCSTSLTDITHSVPI